MTRYLLTKEHFTDSYEWCFRLTLFAIAADGSRDLLDIVKTDTEEDLDEFIRGVYEVTPPAVDGELRFESAKLGWP